jgi:hypothetical protein
MVPLASFTNNTVQLTIIKSKTFRDILNLKINNGYFQFLNENKNRIYTSICKLSNSDTKKHYLFTESI